MGLSFFGLTSNTAPIARSNLFTQIHEIVFHGKGGYDWDTIYNMPRWLRQFTFNKINDFYKKESEVDLKVIGIRPGEKMHEEMISTEEWLRTKKWDNYLIGTDYITDDMWSYNSEDSLMDDDQTYKFLIDSGVIQ